MSMLPDKIDTTFEHTTADDLALNLIHDAILAGRAVEYRGSVESLWGSRVAWMERCEFSHPTDVWRDCCHRQQARVGVLHGLDETELRHVAAFHLVIVDDAWPTTADLKAGQSIRYGLHTILVESVTPEANMNEGGQWLSRVTGVLDGQRRHLYSLPTQRWEVVPVR